MTQNLLTSGTSQKQSKVPAFLTGAGIMWLIWAVPDFIPMVPWV